MKTGNGGRSDSRKVESAPRNAIGTGRVQSVSAQPRFSKRCLCFQHEVEWPTWHALRGPAAVDAEMLHAYNEAVHKSIPKPLGSLGVLASLDKTMYETLASIAEELFHFESETATIAARVRQRKTRRCGIQELATRFVLAER